MNVHKSQRGKISTSNRRACAAGVQETLSVRKFVFGVVSLDAIKLHFVRSNASRLGPHSFQLFNSQLYFFCLGLDPAHGQTTSRQPPPFTLPRTLDQMSSSASPFQSSSGLPQTLDRSQSAPAAMRQASASGLCQEQPGLQLPAENAASAPHEVQPHPLPLVPSPSADIVRESTPPADGTLVSQDQVAETQPGVAEGDTESDEAGATSVLPHPEDSSHIQAMEQELNASDRAKATEVLPSDPGQSDSVEMESPPASEGVASSEQGQPEREQRSSSDSIPSLAAALMELHELLVSNNQAQSQTCASSCPSSHPIGQEINEASPEPCNPTPGNSPPCTPSTAPSAGPSDAKANNNAAAVSNKGPSNCLTSDLSGQDEYLGGDAAETVEGQRPPQHPDGSRTRGTFGQGQTEASEISSSQPEPEVPPDPAGSPELREPTEGHQGKASGSSSPEPLGLQTEPAVLSPPPVVLGSQEISNASSDSSPPLPVAPQLTSPAPLLPSPHPFIEQFPAEHIQRIQAAGFSAMEAAEALERAHGVVELALLALLARSITVPT